MSQFKGPVSRPVLFYLVVGDTTFLRNRGKCLLQGVASYSHRRENLSYQRDALFSRFIKALMFCLQSTACIMQLKRQLLSLLFFALSTLVKARSVKQQLSIVKTWNFKNAYSELSLEYTNRNRQGDGKLGPTEE